MINRATDEYGRTNAILPRSDRAASFTRLLDGGRPEQELPAESIDESLEL